VLARSSRGRGGCGAGGSGGHRSLSAGGVCLLSRTLPLAHSEADSCLPCLSLMADGGADGGAPLFTLSVSAQSVSTFPLVCANRL